MDGPTHDIQKTYLYEELHCNAEFPKNQAYLHSLLTQEAAHTLVQGLVTSHLDYCNAIFAGLPNCLMNILQKVQNASAKLVTSSKKYDSATSSLYQLHWLPIKSRVDFKILTLIHKCLSGSAPEYLQSLISPYKSGRSGL